MIYVYHQQIFLILINQEQVNYFLWYVIYFLIYDKGPGIIDIPTSRRVYETVKSGLEKIGVNYPIGKE